MIALIKTLILLACAPFADAAAKLSSPQFQERQAASRTMKRWLPLSGIALIRVVETTECPEAYERAEKFLSPLAEFREAIRVDAEVNWMVRRPDEIDSLPYLRRDIYRHLMHNLHARTSMQLIIDSMRRRGHFAGKVFYADQCPDAGDYHGEHWMSGINTIRFVSRGLPCPHTSKVPLEDIRQRWLAIKTSR